MRIDVMLRLALVVSCASGLFALDTAELNKRSDKGIKPVVVKDWKAPDESTIPHNMFGDTVRYGKALVAETYKYIGPEVADKTMRYAGNNLACASCHQEAGTKDGQVLLWHRLLPSHNTETVMRTLAVLKSV